MCSPFQTFARSMLAAAVLSIYGGYAWAEPLAASEPAATELQTVNVVGSINKISNVPFRQAKSAVALKADGLKEQGVNKMDEIGRYQAGFTNQPFGSDTNTNWFRVRGVEVGQSFDGAPAVSYGFFTPHTDRFGVEAVEVTKGTDALTYGAAPAGGLINYVSKRPLRNQIGKGVVEARLGNNKRYGIAADYTGAFANPAYRYRLVASYQKADGEWKRTDNESLYFAPSLAFDFASGSSLNILSGIQRDKGTPSSNFLPQSGTLVATDLGNIPRRNNLGDPTQDKEKNTAYWFGYEFGHDFGKGLRFSQNYRYQYADNFHRGAYVYPSAYDAAWQPLALGAANGYSLSRGVVFNDGKAKSHSIDNRLMWKFKNDTLENTLLGGVDYRRQNVDARYTLFGSAGTVNVFNPSTSYGQAQTVDAPQTGIRSEQLGAYLQNNMKLFKRVGINVGVRHDRAKSREVNGQNIKANHTSYSGSLMYFAPWGLNPYLAYSESFMLPTGLGGNQKLYDPNISKQYELGVKYMPSWFDGTVSAAVFKAKDKGALVSGSQGTGATVSSSDPIRRKGAEVQVQGDIGDNISATLAYTYLNSVTEAADGSKTRNPLLPKHSAAVRGSYSFDQGALNGLTVGAGLRYIGSSVSSKGSLYSGAKVPSAALVDLFARYRFAGNWEAQINADNVGDRKFVSGCDYYCYYGQGRSINATVSYKF